MGGTSIVSILLIPTHPSKMSLRTARARKIPWDFLKHKAVYFYCIAIIFQNSGYGIPQTYLSTYARDITQLSEISGTVMLAVFNASGIVASSFFETYSLSQSRLCLLYRLLPAPCALFNFGA